MLNFSLEVEYWILITIISAETANELFLYHLPGRFLSCQAILGTTDRRVKLFLAHLLTACNVLMDLVDRQSYPPHASFGCAARVPLLQSSGRQCGKDIKKLFFS